MMSTGHIAGFTMLCVGLFLQFLETWYFGWNTTPQSLSEQYCDWFCEGLWLGGLLLMVFTD